MDKSYQVNRSEAAHLARNQMNIKVQIETRKKIQAGFHRSAEIVTVHPSQEAVEKGCRKPLQQEWTSNHQLAQVAHNFVELVRS